MSDGRLAAQWHALRGQRRVALIPYLTAGHPTPAASRAALRLLASAGADFVEVGIPFSDPLADGPIIQRASQAALEQGMSVAEALRLITDARLTIPVIAFSYLNPLLAYGLERFGRDAVAAGVAGVLVTDLPAGEDPAAEDALRVGGLDLIRLVAPTTHQARVAAAVHRASGFIYIIARLGVTGARTEFTPELEQLVARVRSATSLPVALGFGIASAEQARAAARLADGVVVGSALVARLEEGIEAAGRLVAELRTAIDSPRRG